DPRDPGVVRFHTRLYRSGNHGPLEWRAAMNTIVVRGRRVGGGREEGEARVTRETVPGGGGVNPVQGVITETRHELRGVSFKDKVLVCRGARGWSGGPAMCDTA